MPREKVLMIAYRDAGERGSGGLIGVYPERKGVEKIVMGSTREERGYPFIEQRKKDLLSVGKKRGRNGLG